MAAGIVFMAQGQIMTAAAAGVVGTMVGPRIREIIPLSGGLQTLAVVGVGAGLVGLGTWQMKGGAGLVGPAAIGLGVGIGLGAISDHFGF